MSVNERVRETVEKRKAGGGRTPGRQKSERKAMVAPRAFQTF